MLIPVAGGALFGIWLLVPVFGIYFALKLARAGQAPQSRWEVALRAIISLAVIAGIIALTTSVISNMIVLIPILGVLVLSAAVLSDEKELAPLCSPLSSHTAGRREFPVVVIMFFAIMGNWGTHYDGTPPDFPETGPFVEWFLTGLFPQLTFWIAFTIIVGMLFGRGGRGAEERRFVGPRGRSPSLACAFALALALTSFCSIKALDEPDQH